MKLDTDNIRVSRHACERFALRHPDPSIKVSYNEKRIKSIKKLLGHAFPIKFNKEHRVKRLLSNDFEETDYLYYEGWIFVVSKNDPRVVITIEREEDRAFGKDLFKII
jgi:hypothetical protein